MRHARKARDRGVPRSMNMVMHRERWCATPATEGYSLSTSQGAERGGRDAAAIECQRIQGPAH